ATTLVKASNIEELLFSTSGSGLGGKVRLPAARMLPAWNHAAANRPRQLDPTIVESAPAKLSNRLQTVIAGNGAVEMAPR
ncbi:MAG: hypothetical protein ACO32Y_11515, partial [Vulcanococcus sp.]